MGKFFSVPEKPITVCPTLKFDDARPTECEEATYKEVQEVLESSQQILDEMSNYKGGGKEVRDAIAAPSDETQERALEAIVPLVQKLKDFYQFSSELERVVPKIFLQLCSGDEPANNLENKQALVKQLAEILEFVLKFDELKMKTPAVQNDLSYYRRTTTRTRKVAEVDGPGEISSDLANRMSLFYANATPMLKVLSDLTSNVATKYPAIKNDHITETLSTMAKVCLRMLDSHDFQQHFKKEETQLFVLRVLVGLVILYDHVHPQGAFVKSSNVDVKGCVRLLKVQPPARSECLLNALRYTTRHFNDDATPKGIKTALSV